MPFVKKQIASEQPIKLFLLLMRQFNISQKEAQKMIDTRKITVDGRIVTDKAAIVQGDVEVLLFEPQTKGFVPIFQTKDFAVFDKSSGVMVHPRNRISGYTLIDEVRHHFGSNANITHRIDKETSGLVLVSKHKKAEKRIKQMFEAKKIQKSYLALVQGKIKAKLFVDEPIAKNRDYSSIKLKVLIDKAGKPSQTIIEPLEIFGDYTLVKATPLTGRQHQIRIHLFHVKHPIVGDPIYGVDTATAIRYLDRELSFDTRVRLTGAPRLMLHAHSLYFPYNKTKYHIVSRYDFIEEAKAITLLYS